MNRQVVHIRNATGVMVAANLLFSPLSAALAAAQQQRQAFVHPGIPLTKSDLDTLRANLDREPWLSGYAG